MSEKTELSLDDYRKRSRRSFLTGGAALAAGFVGWRRLQGSEADFRIPAVLRDVHETNEALWTNFFGAHRLAPEFDIDDASVLQFNGAWGIRDDLDLASWSLTVLGPDGEVWGEHSLDDIKALPFTEMTIRHVCIEGWSQITNWQGTRFSEFMNLYADRITDDITDVYMETPDGEYYVSVDLPTMRHPQTLLAYDNFGVPIAERNGAPLRLATPLKYGIKQIKRIGVIQFRTSRGGDYWGERGYDWFAGL